MSEERRCDVDSGSEEMTAMMIGESVVALVVVITSAGPDTHHGAWQVRINWWREKWVTGEWCYLRPCIFLNTSVFRYLDILKYYFQVHFCDQNNVTKKDVLKTAKTSITIPQNISGAFEDNGACKTSKKVRIVAQVRTLCLSSSYIYYLYIRWYS